MKKQKTTSLFEQMGGMEAVNRATEIFYAKVLDDERVNHFFRWVDMDTQSHKLKLFLAYAFGYPVEYTGKSLKAAHAHLVDQGLNETHFDAVIEHLVSTLKVLDIPDDLVEKASEIAKKTKDNVLGKV